MLQLALTHSCRQVSPPVCRCVAHKIGHSSPRTSVASLRLNDEVFIPPSSSLNLCFCQEPPRSGSRLLVGCFVPRRHRKTLANYRANKEKRQLHCGGAGCPETPALDGCKREAALRRHERPGTSNTKTHIKSAYNFLKGFNNFQIADDCLAASAAL